MVFAAPMVCRVEKRQMPCLCGSHGDVDRLVVAHFPKQDHIGALAECSAQGGDVIVCIHVNFTLADNAAVVAVQEFQRILQGDDVFIPCLVDLINDAGERGRLAAPGGACNKYHAFAAVTKLDDIIWKPKLFWIRQDERDNADDRGECASLFISADTEAGNALDGEGKVIIPMLVELADIAVVCQAVYLHQQTFRIQGGEACLHIYG